MRSHRLPDRKVPFFLYCTYSFCLHAAALSLLVALPVFGNSTSPVHEYVVTLADRVEQPPPLAAAKTARPKEGKISKDEPALSAGVKKAAATEKMPKIAKKDIPEDIKSPEAPDAATVKTGAEQVAENTKPSSETDGIAAPQGKGTEVTSMAKPQAASAADAKKTPAVKPPPVPSAQVKPAPEPGVIKDVSPEPKPHMDVPSPMKEAQAVKPPPPASPSKVNAASKTYSEKASAGQELKPHMEHSAAREAKTVKPAPPPAVALPAEAKAAPKPDVMKDVAPKPEPPADVPSPMKEAETVEPPPPAPPAQAKVAPEPRAAEASAKQKLSPDVNHSSASEAKTVEPQPAAAPHAEAKAAPKPDVMEDVAPKPEPPADVPSPMKEAAVLEPPPPAPPVQVKVAPEPDVSELSAEPESVSMTDSSALPKVPKTVNAPSGVVPPAEGVETPDVMEDVSPEPEPPANAPSPIKEAAVLEPPLTPTAQVKVVPKPDVAEASAEPESVSMADSSALPKVPKTVKAPPSATAPAETRTVPESDIVEDTAAPKPEPDASPPSLDKEMNKLTPPPASPVQAKSPRKTVPQEAHRRPGPVTAGLFQPVPVTAKTFLSGIDDLLTGVERSRQTVAENNTPSKATASGGEGSNISPSLPPVVTAPQIVGKTRGQNLGSAGQADAASERKSSDIVSADSPPAGLSAGGGTSPKKAETEDQAPSGSSAAANGAGPVIGDISGASTLSGGDYELSIPSLSREIALAGVPEDALGDQSVAGGGLSSAGDMPAKEKKTETPKTPVVAIHVPDALLARDIDIKVVAEEKAISDISMDLAVRAHPGDGRRYGKDPARKVETAQVTMGKADKDSYATETLTLQRAERGVYIFSLTNAGAASSVTVVFHLHERSQHERTKEYKALLLKPAAAVKFRFLMPEAIFWDDTDRFSGSIEDSRSVTKFIYDTGLIWKEEKK